MTELYLMFAACIAVFLGVAAYGVIAYRRGTARHAAASAGWTRTEATIVESSLEEVEVTDRDGDRIGSNYRPRARYSYQAGGAERQGEAVHLCRASDFGTIDKGEAWRQRHLPGAVVPLWFDPANPDDCALELNKPSLVSAAIMTVVGIGGAAFFAYMMATMT